MAKKLLFTLLVVLGLLGGAELVLRALMPDLEQVVSPLIYQRNSGQAFTTAKAPGTRRYVAGRGGQGSRVEVKVPKEFPLPGGHSRHGSTL